MYVILTIQQQLEQYKTEESKDEQIASLKQEIDNIKGEKEKEQKEYKTHIQELKIESDLRKQATVTMADEMLEIVNRMKLEHEMVELRYEIKLKEADIKLKEAEMKSQENTIQQQKKELQSLR